MPRRKHSTRQQPHSPGQHSPSARKLRGKDLSERMKATLLLLGLVVVLLLGPGLFMGLLTPNLFSKEPFLCSEEWRSLAERDMSNSSLAGYSSNLGAALMAEAIDKLCSRGKPSADLASVLQPLNAAAKKYEGVNAPDATKGIAAFREFAQRGTDLQERRRPLEGSGAKALLACAEGGAGTSTPWAPLWSYSWRKYLWVAYVPEQLTKARQHLGEALSLARLANRTVILPRVGSSRVGAAWLLPACAYFDTASMGRYVPWVTEDFFLRTVRRLRWRVKSKFLCVLNPGQASCPSALERFLTPSLLLSTLAVAQSSLLDADSAVILHSGYHTARDTSVVARGQEERHLRDAAVRLADQDLLVFVQRSYFFTLKEEERLPALESVRFAPYLHERAEAAARGMGKGAYVCVHIRLEFLLKQILKTTPFGKGMEEGMLQCAKEAVRVAQESKSAFHATHVFLAADAVVHQKNKSGTEVKMQSDSFIEYNSTDTKLALQYISKSLLLLEMELKPITRDALEPDSGDWDPGLKGMLDKLICARSAVFVLGHKACGGGQSFDKEILMIRNKTAHMATAFAEFGGMLAPPQAANSKLPRAGPAPAKLPLTKVPTAPTAKKSKTK